MKLLLDTHTFIWWDSDPSQLSSRASTFLQDPTNSVWLGVVSVWEMVIKSQLGKLTFRLPLAEILAQQQANGLQILPISLDHSLAVESLPAIHRDPFDRMLAAQSIVEDMELVTANEIFNHYPVRILW
jgi:PIN domain nuclease of toxin-antitoxin system